MGRTKEKEIEVMKYEMNYEIEQVKKEIINKYAEKLHEYRKRGLVSRNHYKGILRKFSDEIVWGIPHYEE